MNLTVDQKIKMLLGEYVVQITALQAELEQVKAQLAEKADGKEIHIADEALEKMKSDVANGRDTRE